jgi:hypothetical protein
MSVKVNFKGEDNGVKDVICGLTCEELGQYPICTLMIGNISHKFDADGENHRIVISLRTFRKCKSQEILNFLKIKLPLIAPKAIKFISNYTFTERNNLFG